jgi:hypothetical protein
MILNVGGMAERSKAPVLKTGRAQVLEGSNPSPSANARVTHVTGVYSAEESSPMNDESSMHAPLRPDFNQIVSAFGLQALMACGKIMNPMAKKFEVDLPMADYHIGILDVLLEKTKGNLSDEEKQHIDDMLYQVRMAYVDAKRNPQAVPKVEGGDSATS